MFDLKGLINPKKASLFVKFSTSKTSKKFSRSRMSLFEVFKRCHKLKVFKRTIFHVHPTTQTFFKQANVTYVLFFGNHLDIFDLETRHQCKKGLSFFSSFQLQRLEQNFLDVGWACSSYLRYETNSELSNALTFMVTRPHKDFLMEQTWHMSDFCGNRLEISSWQSQLLSWKSLNFFLNIFLRKHLKNF